MTVIRLYLVFCFLLLVLFAFTCFSVFCFVYEKRWRSEVRGIKGGMEGYTILLRL